MGRLRGVETGSADPPMRLEELRSQAEDWRRADPDPQTAAELAELIARGSEQELAERFAGRLEFGTAGLRATLGAGPNRMNRAVVRQTSAGLARYLLRQAPDVRLRGVVVGRDARRMSREFAEETAGVLAALGIPVHVFPEAVPTPLAAYATLELGTAGAVVVTASHNPPSTTDTRSTGTMGPRSRSRTTRASPPRSPAEGSQAR